jgi:predicted N-acetyltransferase YhbS
MKLRHATSADAAALTSLWNRTLGAGFPMREAVVRLTVFDDPTYREGDALVALDDHIPIGAAWLKRWREPYSDRRFATTAFVGGIAVSEPGHGIGSALLEALEDRARAEGCASIELSGGLLHLLPGVPAQAAPAIGFFEQHGYAFGPEHYVDLHGNPATAAAQQPGIRRAHSADELLNFLAREFPGSWELHARWHLSAGGKPQAFVVAEVDGNVEGFCQIFEPNAWPPGPSTYWTPHSAGLGPIGVSDRLRGEGLGRKLMHGSLYELAQSGARECVIDWTTLVDFYARFGFQPFRSYRRARKPL